MKRSFLPVDFILPTEKVTSWFVLVPLAPEHNQMDYEAWSTSVTELAGIFGPGNPWPTDVGNLHDNLLDLQKHLAGFKNREEATYTVLSRDRARCLGCVYFRQSAAQNYDCRIDFWVRTSDRSDLEPVLYQFLREWAAEAWPFKAVAFTGREISWQDWAKQLMISRSE